MSNAAGTLVNPGNSFAGQTPAPQFKNVVLLTAVSNTLTPGQSGALVLLGTITGNQTVTLPPASVGMNFKFVVSASSAHTRTITCPSAALYGMAWTQLTAAAATSIVAAGLTNAVFTSGASVGAVLDIVCDGAQWYCVGQAVTTGSTDFSAFS